MTAFAISALVVLSSISGAAADPAPPERADYQLPDESRMTPFQDRIPIVFVTRNQPEWSGLKQFWNMGTEETVDPATGARVTRKVVKINLPEGLTTAPPVPAENPMTVEKWVLGKKLYYDPILSTDGTVSCASCHSPRKGFADAQVVSLGIGGALGLINSPTVINSAYNRSQFWDGRAASLEHQSQGPVGNKLEMFSGKLDAWDEAVLRMRNDPGYVKQFHAVFGHGPTRDAAAKAIATYERTVLSGNSLQDRAEAVMRKRVAAEESGKFELTADDYAAMLEAAFAARDSALHDLGLDPARDMGKIKPYAGRLLNGRTLFFGKARCASCHSGDIYSDGSFHNLGIGASKEGVLPQSEFGRFLALPTGHKDLSMVGAFKTPGLRGLLATAPYMHNGLEKTLEEVIELYDRGGNINPYLSEKMRDTEAEAAYIRDRATGKPVDHNVRTFGPSKKPIIPRRLHLSAEEKQDLVLFLKALNGGPLDPLVADPDRYPNR
jgi:cytochrome c peroxidase